MSYLSTSLKASLTRIRERKDAGGYPEDVLTQRERDRLEFHRWRVQRLCPCGYDEEGCRCVTDSADEIAH